MIAAKLIRKLHRWGALITFLPVMVIFLTGVFLQLKKDWAWVQPPTQAGTPYELELTWEELLAAAQGAAEAEIASWEDVDRLDVRPDKGVVKVRAKNRWEVQIDLGSGEVLSSTYRRSDLIEDLHDGSWFHDQAKSWIWLPTAIILCGILATGAYLWILPHSVRRRRRKAAT